MLGGWSRGRRAGLSGGGRGEYGVLTVGAAVGPRMGVALYAAPDGEGDGGADGAAAGATASSCFHGGGLPAGNGG